MSGHLFFDDAADRLEYCQTAQAVDLALPDKIGFDDAQALYSVKRAVKKMDKCARTNLSGFGPGTMITTENGEIPVEWIATGDRVLTRDHGFQPVQKVVRTKLPRTHFESSPNEYPVCIPAGALGSGCPTHDLSLVAQHGVLFRSTTTLEQCSSREVFAPASSWAEIKIAGTIEPDSTYVITQVIFETHEVILAHGAWVESTLAAGKAATTGRLESDDPITGHSMPKAQSMRPARLRLNSEQTSRLLADEMRRVAGVDQQQAAVRTA